MALYHFVYFSGIHVLIFITFTSIYHANLEVLIARDRASVCICVHRGECMCMYECLHLYAAARVCAFMICKKKVNYNYFI
jgi:hypothetical protein